MPVVTFLQVNDNQAKISRMCALVNYLYQQEKKTIITTPNVEVAKYLDAMLWKYPETSFIPHKISNSPDDELILITTLMDPFRDVKTLIHLCPDVHPHFQHFTTIYELYDATQLSKEHQSKKRLEFYKTHKITPQLV